MKYLAFLLLLPIFCAAQPKQGQAQLDSLVAELPKMQEDKEKVILLNSISYLYSDVNQDEGIKYADQALAMAQKLNYKIGEVQAYNDFGLNYQTKADFPNAIAYYFKALRIAEELKNRPLIGQIQGNIGSIYDEKGDSTKAEEYYFKSLNIAEERGDKKLILKVSGNIGTLYNTQKKYKKALGYYKKALNIAEEQGDKRSIVTITGNIGTLYLDLKDYPTALAYSNKALRMAQAIGDKQNLASILGSTGEIYFRIVKDSAYLKPDSLIPAGKAANLAKAIENLTKCIGLSREINYNTAVQYFCSVLSEAYENKGNYKGALEVYRQYVTLKDSIYNLENAVIIANLETKRALELKDKDLQIERLRKSNERWFYIGGMVLLLLSSAFVIKSIQRKKLHEKQAAQLKTMIDTQESERKRISVDLHDDIGTKLTALGMFMSTMKEKAADSSPEIFSLAQSSEQFIREAVSDLRQLLLDLSPSILEEFGYVTAIEGLVKKINETKLVHFNLIIFGIKERLQKDYELALYRITQELINNVLKHAAAKAVSLQVGRRADLIILTIEDDGKGFDLAAHADGYGLKNLAARTALMHGRMTIDTAPGRGTNVLIEIPLKKTA